MRTLVPLALLPLAATVVAQSYSYSPPQYAAVEAAGSNTYPFGGLFRYQQIDGNLGTQPRLVSGIAWRREAAVPGAYPSRAIELELLMSASSLSNPSWAFASNYVGTPQVVFTKKSVNTPDWTGKPVVVPAPFDFALVNDVPFVHYGQHDLLWEVAVTSTSAPFPISLDAAAGNATITHGSYAMLGTGCGNHQLRSSLYPSRTGMVPLAWTVQGATKNAASTLLIGFSDPGLTIPGLCAPLRTDGMIQVAGTASAIGGWSPSAGSLPIFPQYVGAAVFAQAASVDASQPGIPVSMSNGLMSVITDVPQPTKLARLYASGNPTAEAGVFENEFGLVTCYRH